MHGDEEAATVVQNYLDDHRVVDTQMGSLEQRPATVAMEAEWALKSIRGEGHDGPEWMATPDA